MLTPAASRFRDWASFAAAALLPAVATAVLGLRAVANEEAGARREVAAALDAAAERAGAGIERDLARAAAELGRARVAGTIDEEAKAALGVAPPFAEAVVLDANRALVSPPAQETKAKAPAACDAAARALATAKDPARRSDARATLLATCREAQDDTGRWLWPLVALDALHDGQGEAAAIAAWLEDHPGQLAPAERDATRAEIEGAAMDAETRAWAIASLAAAGSRRDELAAALRVEEVMTALRTRRDANGVATWRAGRTAGALRALEDGRFAGYVVTARSLGDAVAWKKIAAPPGVVVDVVAGSPPAAHARAGAGEPLAARADVATELALRFAPADGQAIARHAARSRMLLFALAAVTTLGAFGFAAVLFARMRAARRSSALRTDFVSTVSHELRTPIASVRMLAELLEQDRVEPEERAEVHEALARESRRLGETVDRLLGFSRMEAGRYALARKTIRLAEAVEPSIVTFEERHPDLAVERDLDPAAEASVDVDQLRLAIDNLLANAAKYAPAGAPYRVRVAANGDGAMVSVADHGPGIARRDQARIFRPFERADDRLSRATEGSGIGLSLVSHVARAHGGKVSLESAPGKGATFTLWIPRSRR
jgi:two-component system phosphate regulon sensor histidine kinase PhoR